MPSIAATGIAVLSIQQPYASAYCYGPKRFENRHWGTAHRGPLLIHAGKSTDRMLDLKEVGFIWDSDDRSHGRAPSTDRGLTPEFFGAIIGAVELIDCTMPEKIAARGGDYANDPWVDGPFCFERSERRLRFSTPIPFRGMQSIFRIGIGTDSLIPQPQLGELRAWIDSLAANSAEKTKVSPAPC